jgi:dCTP deaminase
MILSGHGIVAAIERGELSIDPFDERRVGTNGVILTLGPRLIQYCHEDFDVREEPPPGYETEIMEGRGFLLRPGFLYLGHSVERTRIGDPWVPFIEGRSTLSRMGLTVIGGSGSCGFEGQWTFPITVARPIRVYRGTEIARLYLSRREGGGPLYAGRYQNQSGPMPGATRRVGDFEPGA